MRTIHHGVVASFTRSPRCGARHFGRVPTRPRIALVTRIHPEVAGLSSTTSAGQCPTLVGSSIRFHTLGPPLLLVFLDDLVVGLNYVFLAVGPLGIVGGAFLRGVTGCSLTLRLLSLCIQRLARLAVSTRQLLVRRLDLVHVLATQRLPCALHGTLELGLEVRRQTVRPLLGILFHLVGQTVETVARVDFVAPLLVLARMRLGVLHHTLDLALREPA